jgi:hypothetical protein
MLRTRQRVHILQIFTVQLIVTRPERANAAKAYYGEDSEASYSSARFWPKIEPP